jgi:hypothetical protein
LITWIVVITLAVLVVVIMLVGAWAYQTANRLDRLHVRYDLSWQALDGVLARRKAGGSRPWPTRPNTRRDRRGKPPRTSCRRDWRSSTRPHCQWPW